MTKRSSDHSQADIDNRADQLNPNHDAYWQSRGEEERPDELARPSRAGNPVGEVAGLPEP